MLFQFILFRNVVICENKRKRYKKIVLFIGPVASTIVIPISEPGDIHDLLISFCRGISVYSES